MTRPTYANVVATLALVVALGGTAYAAGPRNSVGPLQLKKNAVTTVKIKGGAVTSPKIRNGAVTPADLGPGARALARSGPPTVVSGGINDLPPVGLGISYERAPISGTTNAGAPTDYQSSTPAVPVRASGLAVTIYRDLPAGASVTVHLAATTELGSVGGDPLTSVGCTITGTDGPDDRSCTSTTSVVLPAASVVYVRYLLQGSGSAVADPVLGRHGLVLAPLA